jgi:pimeloyl-ACP methyl ester carboxylesterase
MADPQPDPHPGILHRYTTRLVAFEHTPYSVSTSTSPTATATNFILWIGGLGDGLATVSYPAAIAATIPPASRWSVVEVLLSSSYGGWRTGSLKRDADEVERCVEYFRWLQRTRVEGGDDGEKEDVEEKRKHKGKIVLMGHSTGCQDIMEYLIGPGTDAHPRSPVDAIILQGGVSDREDTAARLGPRLDAILSHARTMIDAGHSEEILPLDVRRQAGDDAADEFKMSAYRAWALYAKGGDDDYFSSDIPYCELKSTFGKIPSRGVKAVTLLLGERDPHVPAHVDMEGLLRTWRNAVLQGVGGEDPDEVGFSCEGRVLEGATHNLNGDPEEVVRRLVDEVLGVVGKLGGMADTSGAEAQGGANTPDMVT